MQKCRKSKGKNKTGATQDQLGPGEDTECMELQMRFMLLWGVFFFLTLCSCLQGKEQIVNTQRSEHFCRPQELNSFNTSPKLFLFQMKACFEGEHGILIYVVLQFCQIHKKRKRLHMLLKIFMA